MVDLSLSSTSNNEIVYVDGRDGGSLSELLGKALSREKKQRVGQLLSSNLVISEEIARSFDIVTMNASVPKRTSLPVEELSQFTLDAIFHVASPCALIEAYIQVCEERRDDTLPTIIIDQFSCFVKNAEMGTNLEKLALYHVLQLFAKFTKQDHKCKVILVSSEHAFLSVWMLLLIIILAEM